jgi:hypothetical protein
LTVGAARIIEGHSDSSMKGQVPESAVQELSFNRANRGEGSVVRKFPTLQPTSSPRRAMGWARPRT